MDLLKKTPTELLEYMYYNYSIPVPASVETVEEMESAGKLLSVFTNNYSFLCYMALLADTETRNLRKTGARKFSIDDSIAKKKILEKYAELMKQSYSAVSRMITIKQQVNQELHMSDSRNK